MPIGDEYKDKLLLYRLIEQQYRIEQYTDASLKKVQKALDVAREQLFDEITARDIVLSVGREDDVLRELNRLTFGIQTQLSNDIVNASVVAGEYSFREYDNILSFDGKLAETVGFNFSAVSPAQVRAMVISDPVSGGVLSEWVAKTSEAIFSEEMKTELMAGMFLGEGHIKLVKRLEEGFETFRSHAISLSRTYIADINNRAAKSVYDANSDIIKKEEWNSTLEVSMKGNSTCIRCACMDGKTFLLSEQHVRPPLHLRCRCFMLPKTVSYRELGLDIDEMKTSLRPYTEREAGTSIDAGLSRDILKAGQFDGNFEKFLFSRDVKYQKDLLGPNRYRLIQEGKIKFGDLIDKNGNVKLLKKDKNGNYTGLL